MYTSNFIFDLILSDVIPYTYNQSWGNSLTPSRISASTHTLLTPSTNLLRVKNIPSYFNLEVKSSLSLNIKTFDEHIGYLANLSTSKNETDYISKYLNHRNKKNLFAKKKKLEEKGNIHYKVFRGDSLNFALFDELFQELYVLLKNRFNQKKIYNRDLEKWDDIKKKVFPMIQQNKAILFVIYDSLRPINITLNFHLGDIVFSHIQSFDLNYSSYNLPDISMLKQLEWCYLNKIEIYDLMIGKTYYKEKWSNTTYSLQNHIFYKSSPWYICYSSFVIYFYRIKRYVRNKILLKNISIDHVLFHLKGGNS